MNSNAFKSLKESIDNLIKKIPPYQLEDGTPIIEFDETQKDLYTLVVILSHAEIESYYEEVADEIIHISGNKYFDDSVIDSRLAHLLYRLYRVKDFNTKLSQLCDKKINNYINEVTDFYIKNVIEENHGTSSEKIYWIFYAIGLEKEYQDYSDMVDYYIEEIKNRRGTFVHKSLKYRIKEEIKPKDLHTQLVTILKEIEAFDKQIMN